MHACSVADPGGGHVPPPGIFFFLQNPGSATDAVVVLTDFSDQLPIISVSNFQTKNKGFHEIKRRAINDEIMRVIITFWNRSQKCMKCRRVCANRDHPIFKKKFKRLCKTKYT